MGLYPDVQKKARAEIDAVVGSDRLPTYEDQQSLPYIDAIVKEVLRWRPGIPLGAFVSSMMLIVFQRKNCLESGVARRCMQVSADSSSDFSLH